LRKGPKNKAPQNVKVTEGALIVDLSDGRTMSVPLAWFPRLLHGTPEERNTWRLIGGGEGIHWPDLDEEPMFPSTSLRTGFPATKNLPSGLVRHDSIKEILCHSGAGKNTQHLRSSHCPEAVSLRENDIDENWLIWITERFLL
jgi:hypothetical protein